MKPLFENKRITYTTKIKIPISEFNNEDEELRENFAKRATSLATQRAREQISKSINIIESQLPLDLVVESIFEMITLGKSVFKVIITGKSDFINKIN